MANSGLPLRSGEVLEGGWVVLACGWCDLGLTHVMAAKCDDGIGVVASWSLEGGVWRCWTVDTEEGRPAREEDDLPPEPPQRRKSEPVDLAGRSVKRHGMILKGRIPDGWDNRVVKIWHEDECLRNDPDAERIYATAGSPGGIPREGAWKRITGRQYDRSERIASADHGDTFLHLHSGGWVEVESFDGSSIGVVAEVYR